MRLRSLLLLLSLAAAPSALARTAPTYQVIRLPLAAAAFGATYISTVAQFDVAHYDEDHSTAVTAYGFASSVTITGCDDNTYIHPSSVTMSGSNCYIIPGTSSSITTLGDLLDGLALYGNGSPLYYYTP